jgi:hypothetical protein
MPRYLPKNTSRRSGIDATIEREMEQYRNQILRELKREGERTIKQFQDELRKSLNDEIKKNVSSISSSSGNGRGSTSAATDGIGGIASLLGGILNLYLSRPRISRTSSETERSRNEAQQFRVSRTQALADAAASMNAANKNI